MSAANNPRRRATLGGGPEIDDPIALQVEIFSISGTC
jgi:hypothetical protein